MDRDRRTLPQLAAVGLILAGAALPLAGQPAKRKPAPHPAIRPLTTAEIAGWLCKGLPGNDPRTLAATFLDGKLQGTRTDENVWDASVLADGKELLSVNLMGAPHTGWVLNLYLEGDWHGISEKDWAALAHRIPGRAEEGEYGGHHIQSVQQGESGYKAGYESKAGGVRELSLYWGNKSRNPSAWFCPKG